MRCETFFCDFVHTFSTDLHFHPLAARSHYRCVQGFIPVTFWCRDPVAQTIWIWTIQIRNNRIYFPAFGFFLLVFGVDYDTNGKQIIHFFKWRSEEHTSELQSRENLVCRL